MRRWMFDSKSQPRLVLTVGRGEVRRCLSLAGAGSEQWRELASFDLRKPPFDVVGISDDGKQLYVTEESAAGQRKRC